MLTKQLVSQKEIWENSENYFKYSTSVIYLNCKQKLCSISIVNF